ncbi:TPA: hypothetical protein N0F65_005739 [Lagenidium giganteum]|uniref:Uncharacterized protein n=1 Tax=Lagenidium giganteum TaxID=4803 RepID=A0AAV2ZCX1_9STRA|nr:TPA: hypothetical protein N0F65_005739 [Lagenidium giganteum]
MLLYAEILPLFEARVFVVRPWFRTKPGCALIELSGAGETPHAIAERLAVFDEEAVALGSSHYPPERAQLVGLKTNNVTLIEWNEDAALTQTHHPRVRYVFLVRFNATSIPPGLLSVTFRNCCSISRSVCRRCRTCQGMCQQCGHQEHGYFYFSAIPDVLVDMRLTYLALSFNQISMGCS